MIQRVLGGICGLGLMGLGVSCGADGDSTESSSGTGPAGSSSAATPEPSSPSAPGTTATPAPSSPSAEDSTGPAPSSTTDDPSADSSSGDPGSTGEPVDDPCSSETSFCEDFDGYPAMTLADEQTFGPWRASLRDQGSTMDLDGTHTTSGRQALHMRLEQGDRAGGRLYTDGGVSLLEPPATHIYGRMMMYIGQNGTSTHWTFFGGEGVAEPESPQAGNYAAYIMSSLPRDGQNTYAFVDGLSGGPNYQDCWARGMETMPTGEWSCIAFEMDTLERRLRMYKDGAEEPIVAVDDRGDGCVPPVAGDSLWWGPLIDRLFVGAWSFHPLEAPLEVWIDDLVVDSVPVACP